MLKNTLQLLFAVVLMVQLTGCYYEVSDRHYHPGWHHHHHDEVVVVGHVH